MGGDVGCIFYIVKAGTLSIHVADTNAVDSATSAEPNAKARRKTKQVGSLGVEKSFGELGLLFKTPRAATITAAEDVVLYALDREAYIAIRQHYKGHIATAADDHTSKKVIAGVAETSEDFYSDSQVAYRLLNGIDIYNNHKTSKAKADQNKVRKHTKHTFELSRGDFFEAVHTLADRWTDSCEVSEYVSFLKNLIGAISYEVKTTETETETETEAGAGAGAGAGTQVVGSMGDIKCSASDRDCDRAWWQRTRKLVHVEMVQELATMGLQGAAGAQFDFPSAADFSLLHKQQKQAEKIKNPKKALAERTALITEAQQHLRKVRRSMGLGEATTTDLLAQILTSVHEAKDENGIVEKTYWSFRPSIAHHITIGTCAEQRINSVAGGSAVNGGTESVAENTKASSVAAGGETGGVSQQDEDEDEDTQKQKQTDLVMLQLHEEEERLREMRRSNVYFTAAVVCYLESDMCAAQYPGRECEWYPLVVAAKKYLSRETKSIPIAQLKKMERDMRKMGLLAEPTDLNFSRMMGLERVTDRLKTNASITSLSSTTAAARASSTTTTTTTHVTNASSSSSSLSSSLSSSSSSSSLLQAQLAAQRSVNILEPLSQASCVDTHSRVLALCDAPPISQKSLAISRAISKQKAQQQQEQQLADEGNTPVQSEHHDSAQLLSMGTGDALDAVLSHEKNSSIISSSLSNSNTKTKTNTNINNTASNTSSTKETRIHTPRPKDVSQSGSYLLTCNSGSQQAVPSGSQSVSKSLTVEVSGLSCAQRKQSLVPSEILPASSPLADISDKERAKYLHRRNTSTSTWYDHSDHSHSSRRQGNTVNLGLALHTTRSIANTAAAATATATATMMDPGPDTCTSVAAVMSRRGSHLCRHDGVAVHTKANKPLPLRSRVGEYGKMVMSEHTAVSEQTTLIQRNVIDGTITNTRLSMKLAARNEKSRNQQACALPQIPPSGVPHRQSQWKFTDSHF